MEDNYKVEDFTHLHWKGTFKEYIDLVAGNPKITRNSFQRMFDMILSHGTSTYNEYKKEITRYHFFDDPFDNGADAVFGIDVHLMKLVNFLNLLRLDMEQRKGFSYYTDLLGRRNHLSLAY